MKYKVSANTITKDLELRGRQFLIEVDDKTAKDPDKLMEAAQTQAVAKYGAEVRVTRVTKW